MTSSTSTSAPARRRSGPRRGRRGAGGGPGDALRAAAAVLALLLPGPAAGAAWPAPVGYLSDFAGVVDGASADSIEALALELRGKTGAELAVVTRRDLGGEPIENASEELFRQWGIGGKGRDDGVLVLLAVAERRVRIEVGYGLEGVLPDARCGFIIRRVMGPALAADRFGPGLLRGADAIAGVIARDRGVTLAPGRGRALPEDEDSGGHSLLPLVVLFLLILGFSWLMRRFTGGWGDWRSRRVGPGPFWGGGGWGGYGGSFGGHGGGFGGGFGGFGGGRSGGGGASGGF